MSTLLFGLDVTTSAASSGAPAGTGPIADARTAEALGFDFVSAFDHPCGRNPSYETWTMLTWIAANTSRIRLATRVLGVPYRPPAMVAKMAETLSRLSGGRLILGLGAGSADDEFRAFGLRVPSPRDKVDGLEEAVRIIRGLWSQPRFSFDGRLYGVDAAEIEPKPAHAIPVWLGTFGPRALAVTGRVADGWIPSLGHAPPAAIPEMRARILDAALDAGRDPRQLTCAYNLQIRVDPVVSSEQSAVVGPVDHAVERLVGFTGLGFTAFNFQPVGPDRRAQLDRLAGEVVPAVRAAVGAGIGSAGR
jgi:alkanesulfonate monooxygenase SsuD/methylene tetrahydromethanopterin reductase-like flavin-dependent oxidoreductase (luciferase family)